MSEKLRLVARPDEVDILVGDKHFTTYRYAAKWVRPYFYPVHAPDGRAVTRGYPMDPHEGERQDHPHHKSLWVAYGSINGCDVWSETADKKTGVPTHGYQVQHAVQLKQAEGERVTFAGSVDWQDVAHKKLMEETRTVTASATEAGWLLEWRLDFHASEGDVTFGDTKEAGLCSVRVATSMDPNGDGKIENSEGITYERGLPKRTDVKGQESVWGRRARWISYSGHVADKPASITLFDHPSNLRHPTYWHARGYGLCGANPFGVSVFENDKTKNGSYTIKHGEHLVFRYQILVAAHDTTKKENEKQFKAFAGS